FLAAMIVVTFAWFTLGGRLPALASLGVSLLAAFTCGVKATIVMTPLLLGLTVLVGRAPRGARASTVVLAGIGLFAAGVVALEASSLVALSTQTGLSEASEGFLTGVPRALSTTLTGFGTGYATGASRYALDNALPLVLAAGQGFSESWWVKVVLELGL